MTPSEVADLLASVQAFDRRTVGDADILAWYQVLGAFELDDCVGAVVQHYAYETEWLMPGHVRRIVVAARNDRADRTLPALPGPGAHRMPSWWRGMYEASLNETRASGKYAANKAGGALFDPANPPMPGGAQ